jgi:hypothetical protein
MKKSVSLAAGTFIIAAAFSTMLSTGTASALSYDDCHGHRVELAVEFGALVPPCVQKDPSDSNSWWVDTSQLPHG